MTDYIKTIPLQASPYYETAVELEGQQFRIIFRWSDRLSCYFFDLLKDDGTKISLDNRLLLGENLLSNTDLTDYGITGFFRTILYSENNEGVVIASPSDVFQYYFLTYLWVET